MNKSESKYYNTALLMDNALLDLLSKKEYEFISVKEVCIKAGVSRSTFYLHYETMDDLLEETIQMINKKFHSYFENLNINGEIYSSVLTVEKYLRPYLNFIKENYKVYKLMHEKFSLFHFDTISASLYSELFEPILRNFGIKESEREYLFCFYTEGTLAVIKAWTRKACEEDIDVIIDFIMKYTMQKK